MCVGKGREWGSPFISLITTTEQNTEKQANRYSDNDGARSNVPRREWMPLNQSREVRSCWMHSAAALQQRSGWEHPPAAAQHTLPGPEQLPSPGHRAAAPVAAVGISRWSWTHCTLLCVMGLGSFLSRGPPGRTAPCDPCTKIAWSLRGVICRRLGPGSEMSMPMKRVT